MHSSKRLLLAILLMTLGLRAQQTYPSGTAFQENWTASTNATACWSGGPSDCAQPWIVTGTLGQSVVSAPSGFTAANALQISQGTAAAALQTYGSFPATTSGTWTFHFDPTSATPPNFQNFLAVGQSAATGGCVSTYDTFCLTFEDSGGSWAVFAQASTSTSAITLSASTAHTIVIHVDATPANSYLQIDGGTDQAFTTWSNAMASVRVGNLNGIATAATWIVGDLTESGTSVAGNWPPSAFFDWAGATAGTATSSQLTAGTHCGNGTWSATPATNYFTFATGAPSLAAAVSACGQSYGGNTGLWLVYTNDASTSAPDYFYNPATVYSGTVAAVGVLVNISVSTLDGIDTSDILAIDDGGAGTHNFNVCGTTQTTGPYTCSGGVNDTTLLLCLETSAGSDYACVPITNGDSYWLTTDSTATGADQANVYAWPSMSVVAQWSFTDGAGGGGARVDLGPTGSENPAVNVTWKYSNLILEYANAQFPVLPPSGSAGACRLSLLGVGPC